MRPGGGANKRRGKADEQGNTGPVDQAGEHITAKFVGAKPVRHIGRAKLQALVEFIGIVWGNDVGKDGGESHDQDDH